MGTAYSAVHCIQISETMDMKKQPSQTDDKVSAEGQVFDAAHRMPESLCALSETEVRSLNRKLVRKVDLIVLPTIGILYILNFIDRQNLASAKLQGIMEDLNMNTDQFATAVSILFVGYLPFQIPSNLLITKISRPGMYICFAVAIWGCISASTAAVKTYGQLLAVRAILGAAEAVFFPGAIYYLSAWYTKMELGKRIAGLYIAQQVGNAFGGLFAAAILQLDGTHNIRGWQWLFIIEGSMTISIALLVIPFIPDYPMFTKRWWLTHEQQILAVSCWLLPINLAELLNHTYRTGDCETRMPDLSTTTPTRSFGASSKLSSTQSYTCSSYCKWR